MARIASLTALVLAVAGCTGTKDVPWTIRFRTTALADRAVYVEASIHPGTDCTSAPVYSTLVARPGTVSMPPGAYDGGVFTFCARAIDDHCTWFASGMGTPTPDGVETVLDATTETTECGASLCTHGTCGMDAGTPPPMDGRVDTGPTDLGPPPDMFPDLTSTDLGCRAINVLQVAAGGDTTCAVDVDGNVWCWGANDHAQTGAAGPDVVRPTEVGLPTHASSVAVGGAHACAFLAADGGPTDLYCWGANDHGQLGTGAAAASSPPSRVVGDFNGIVAAGRAHTCASQIVDGGIFIASIACWGANESGQLGLGDTMERHTPVTTPFMGYSVAAGDAHTCGLDIATFTMACAGANESGQLGRGGTPGDTTVPGDVGTLGTPVTGGHHSCAGGFASGGQCWGANDRGQLGVGDMVTSYVPRDLPDMGITPATAGEAFTCGTRLRTIGGGGRTRAEIFCWGASDEGESGPGGDTPSPRLVATMDGTSVVAGRAHACAVERSDGGIGGRLVCWGADHHGQLGRGGAGGHDPTPLPVCF